MWRYLPGLLFVLLTAFLLMTLSGEPDKHEGDIVGTRAPAISAMPLNPGETVPSPARLAASEGPILINFFASWCTPCQAEQPQLLELKQRFRVPIIGIAWHDDRAKIRDYLDKHDNPYRFAGLDIRSETTVAYGATGVPESFLIDRSGQVIHRISGPITPQVLKDELLPRLGAKR